MSDNQGPDLDRDELAKLTEPQREWARQADERCPSCGRLGFRFRCPSCERPE